MGKQSFLTDFNSNNSPCRYYLLLATLLQGGAGRGAELKLSLLLGLSPAQWFAWLAANLSLLTDTAWLTGERQQLAPTPPLLQFGTFQVGTFGGKRYEYSGVELFVYSFIYMLSLHVRPSIL